MKTKNKSDKTKSTVKFFFQSYVVTFIIISFSSTCGGIILLHNYGEEQLWLGDRIWKAGLNIFVLTAIIAIFISFFKYFLFDRPVKNIIDATDKISNGDFTIRLPENKVFLQDINLIYKNFNNMAEQLSQTENIQSGFISNVSHEMKTPLAVIQNYSTLLQTPGISEEERKEYTQVIFDTTNKMTQLVTNILKLNKLENQQIKLDNKKFNLSDSVSECLLGFEQIWEQKKINIETDIQDDVIVNSDKNLLCLVWNNLISNAMKFTEEDGTVKVSCYICRDNAVVEVKDSGCGISKEAGRHIFDKFYQGDTSHKTQGNGLGLAMVKKVIDLTGSEINVQSEVGKGTTFTVKLKKGEA